MVDPKDQKDQKDPKGLHKQAPSDPQARPEKDEITLSSVGKISKKSSHPGGADFRWL
jgi:hypothetical protein